MSLLLHHQVDRELAASPFTTAFDPQQSSSLPCLIRRHGPRRGPQQCSQPKCLRLNNLFLVDCLLLGPAVRQPAEAQLNEAVEQQYVI